MPRAWSPAGVRSGSSPGRASTRASVARLVALQALLAWIRSVPVVMSSCYAKSASLCPEWPVGDVPRDMPPEASWTAIRSPRTSTRGVGFLPAALLPGTPCTSGNFPLPICWVCRLESVYGIARQFLSDEGVRRSRTGVVPGGPRRRRTVGKTASNFPRKPPENRRKTVGKPLVKLPGKPPGNRREKPRFWVTFASLNKGPEWPGRASPASFFGPWGGCHKETTSQAQRMYSSIRWGWWNGDLWVFRRDEGPSRSDEGFCGISRITHA